MKTYFTVLLLLLSTFIFAQKSELKKIEDGLNKNLQESHILKGLYEAPSYSFKSASIADNGDLTLTYTDKDYSKTFSLKDANIEVSRMKVRLYVPAPSVINITFYSKNDEAIGKLLMQLQEMTK